MLALARLFIAVCAVALAPPLAAAEKRAALVIGNAAYANAPPLANPRNDATDLANTLKALGFEVILGLDLNKRSFDQKIRAFAELLEVADTGLLFYAGHGLQVAGQNYLVPDRCPPRKGARSGLRYGSPKLLAPPNGTRPERARPTSSFWTPAGITR